MPGLRDTNAAERGMRLLRLTPGVSRWPGARLSLTLRHMNLNYADSFT